MKTIEQYFSYNVQGDSNCFVWGLKSLNVTIHMKAIEQYFSGAVYDTVQGSCNQSVNEILKCDYANESYWAIDNFPVVLCIML